MAMRITNSMMTNNSLMDLMNNKVEMDKYGRQMSTFRRINRLGDDPTGLVTALQTKRSLSGIGDYQAGIRDVTTRVEASEDAILSINEIVKRVYELAVDAATDGKTAKDRQVIAQEIKQMRDQILDNANASVNGNYIFAGYNTTNRPFSYTTIDEGYTITVDQVVNEVPTPTQVSFTISRTVMTYNGEIMDENYRSTTKFQEELEQHVKFEVGPDGTFFDTGFNGIDLMDTGDQNLFNLLSKFYDTLMFEGTDVNGEAIACDARDVIPQNGQPSYANPDGIHFIDTFLGMQKKYLVKEADIGGRSNRLSIMEERYSLQKLSYEEQASLIIDADIAQAMTQFKTVEAMYQAALQATAKIIQPSLMDYMR